MASSRWLLQVGTNLWRQVDSIDLEPGGSSAILRFYMDASYSANQVTIEPSSSSISVTLGTISTRVYPITVRALSSASGTYTLVGTTPNSTATLTINVGGGSGGGGEDPILEWQNSSGTRITSVNMDAGSSTTAYLYSNTATSANDFTISSSSTYEVSATKGAFSNRRCAIQISAADDASGGYTVTGMKGSATTQLRVNVDATSNVTYDVSSLPDEVEVEVGESTTVSATYSPSGASTSGAQLTLGIANSTICSATSVPNAGITQIRITGKKIGSTILEISYQGTYLKSIIVNVKSGVSYSGFPTGLIILSKNGQYPINVKYTPSNATSAQAVLTGNASSSTIFSYTISSPANGSINILITGAQYGEGYIEFYNGIVLVATVYVQVKEVEFTTPSSKIEYFTEESITGIVYYTPESTNSSNVTLTCSSTPQYNEVSIGDPSEGQIDIRLTGISAGTETLVFKHEDTTVWTVEVTVKANISFSGPLEAYVSDTITYTATATGSMISMMYAGEQVGCETMIETDPDNSAVIHIVAINKTQPEASFKVFARLETGDEYYRLVKVLDRVTVTGPSWILAGDSSDNPYTYVIEDIKGTLSQFSIRAIKGCTVDPVVDEANKALKIRSSIRLKEESEFVVGAELASGTLSFVHTDVTGTILDLVLEGTSTATVGTEVTVTAKLNYDNLESTFTFALAEGSVPADIDPDKSTQLGTFVFTPKETGTLIVQCTADEYPDIGAKTIEINIIEGSAELTGPSELAVGTSGEYTVAIASGTLDQFKVENEVGCTVEYYQGVEMNILTVAPTGKTVSNATFDVVANLIGGEPMSIHVSVLDPVFILRLNAPTTAYVGRTFWVSASLNVAGYPDTYTWATSGAAATIIQTSDNSVQLKPESVGALVVKCTPAKHGSVQTVTIIVTESDVDYVMVTFNANGGSTEVANMEVISGRSIILPEATRFNKVLVGWSTSTSDVQLVGRSGDRYKVDSSQILYAIWRDLNVERSDCYLSRAYGYDQKGNTLVTETMYFDVVDSIEDTVTANLSSTSTVVFGAANRYIMDLGNSRKFTLNISRANPAGYNDSSTDQRRWSNGKWLREFFNFIDFWQNFGRDPRTGKNTGGFLFHFNPPSDATDLYPTIEKNVFITGTISPSYAGPQKIQLSIPLQVANMDIGGAGNPTEMVTYKSGKSGMFDFTQTFTLGATVSIPSMPIEWQDAFDGSILVAWKGSNGRTYYPNEIAKLTTGMTLTAQWKNCWYRASIENSSWSVIADGRLMIYAVGGGGAGASLRTDTLHVGGGGGAGETRIITIPVRKGDEVEWIIGSGGKASYSDAVYGRNDGEDGENTVVTINGLEVLTSRGGAGGKVPPQNLKGDRPLTGLGGAGWGQGGTSKIPKWADGDAFIVDATDGVKGGNGTTIAPNSNDSVGKGKYGGTTKNNIDQTIPWMGGSGGGASGLNVRVGSATYISRGGDGGYISGTKFTDVEAPVSGVYGGGGGSGPNSLGGAGGSGLVILIFYSA